MRQSVGLAGSGPGQDEQRTRADALVRNRGAESSGATLPRIEGIECVGLGFHHRELRYCTYIQITTQQLELAGASPILPLARAEPDHTPARLSAMIVT